MLVPDDEPEKPSHTKSISFSVASTFLTSGRAEEDLGPSPGLAVAAVSSSYHFGAAGQAWAHVWQERCIDIPPCYSLCRNILRV